jgi:hypothetical protein
LKKFDFKLNETRKDEDNDDNLIFELKPSSWIIPFYQDNWFVINFYAKAQCFLCFENI